MLSRVADALYWMSRYIERADNMTRFVNVTEHLTLDMPGARDRQWRALVAATGDDDEYLERHQSFDRDGVIRFLAFDGDYRSSIWSCVRSARENARGVREVISADVWTQINKTYLFAQRSARNPDPLVQDPEPFIERMEQSCYAILGAVRLTMSHEDPWRFMQVGRLLERADKASRILDVKYFLLPESGGVDAAVEELQWSALLQNVSALEMYRQRHGSVTPRKALRFLLFDATFPRSIRFTIETAEAALRGLEHRSVHGPLNPAERKLGKLRASLEFGSVDEVLELGLHDWVDGFQRELNEVGGAIQDVFFALPEQSQSQSQS